MLVSTNLVDVLAVKLGEELLQALVIGLDTDSLKDALLNISLWICTVLQGVQP